MKRQQTGFYEITSIGDEQVRALILNPLPPEEVLDMNVLTECVRQRDICT